MNKILLRKSKGQWITVSLALAVVAGLSSNTVLAQEIYSVQPNDTLMAIGRKFNVSVSDLMSWNNLDSSLIHVGTQLRVQADNASTTPQPTTPTPNETNQSNESTTQTPVTPTPTQTTTSGNRQVHVVRAGESLNIIGSRYGVSADQIKAWNGLTSNLIHPGNQLYVSAGSTTQPTPTPTPTPETPSTPSNATTYTVVRGDYLHKIATQYGITVQNLKDWNNLTSNYIYVGDVLKVQAPSTSTPTPTPDPTPTPNPSTQKTYTVVRGDYLHKIATQYGITVQNLKDWNNLTSNYIYVGDVLKVQAPSTSTPTPTPDPTPTPTPNPSTPKTYTVVAGDYLHKIATQYGITVQNLKDWNNLTSNYIYVGDVLQVQAPSTSTPTPNPTPTPDPEPTLPKPPANPNNAKTYTIKSGDSLATIAASHNISTDNLIKWNTFTNNKIYVGQVLFVSDPAVNPSTPEQPGLPGGDGSTVERTTYVVVPGDNLWKIANQYGVTIANIRKWNDMDSNYIYSGDVLYVAPPGETDPEPEPDETPDPAPTPSAKTHTVVRGEYLHKIATQYGITVNQLKDWNNMTSNYIYVGDVLYVSRPSSSDGGSTNNPITDIQGSIPDLSTATARNVNYDVKLNSTTHPLRSTRSLVGSTRNAVDLFGQRFTVRREYVVGGRTFMELQNTYGTVVGYVAKEAAAVVPQGVNTVYLDAGHGGPYDSGPIKWGVTEKELNLNITTQLAQRLRAQGYTVYESRTRDVEIPLHERTDEPNELMPDIYVSIHHNAMPIPGSAHGIVTLYHDESIVEENYETPDHHHGTDIIPEGKRLANSIQNALIAATNANNQGTRPQNLHVTRTTDVPATLVELGFMDHWGEHQKLIDQTYQQKLISGLVTGINAYFGRTR